MPVMAMVKTDTDRLWVYVRDDRPFTGADPPAALFHCFRDRRGEHPRAHLASSAILQVNAYGGYGELYAPGRMPVLYPLIQTAASTTSSRRRGLSMCSLGSPSIRPTSSISGCLGNGGPIRLRSWATH